MIDEGMIEAGWIVMTKQGGGSTNKVSCHPEGVTHHDLGISVVVKLGKYPLTAAPALTTLPTAAIVFRRRCP